VPDTQKEQKRREASLDSGKNYNNIIPKKGMVR
jgi:hypothetical protein